MQRRLLTTFLSLALFAVMLIPRGAGALTIGPPTFEFILEPGDTALDVIEVRNEDDEAITVYPILMNFEADADEGGTPQFYPPEEDRLGRGLASWVTVDPKPLTIQPGQRIDVQFSVNVPAERAQPGGHYGAIILSTTPPEVEGSQVAIGQQIAALILVRVGGDVKELGGIAELGFTDPQVWYNHLPVDFFLRFENTGNTHLRPTGNLFIKDWMGRQVASIKINEAFRSVLPLSIRRYEFGWAHNRNVADDASGLSREWKNFALGKYTATLVVNYGSTNQIVTDTRTFYVWPWRLMSIFGGALLVVIVLLVVLKKAYDKAVIKKYEHMAKNAPQPPMEKEE